MALHTKYSALAVATGLLICNFFAWSLISPLATTYAKQFQLSPVEVSILIAAPVLIGSLGRIPLGLLTDRYGGRKLFATVCLLSSLAVCGLAAANSHAELLATATCLGIAGASFAVGVPFVNSWFPKQQRGLALGLYAMGNAGTAASGLATPRLINISSTTVVFGGVAIVLFVAGIAMALYGRNAPDWQPSKVAAVSRLKKAASWPLTWRLGLLYAITFGAFVALGLYLPVLLNQSYGLTVTDAAARAAGFVILATVARPLGGWLSDRLNGIVVLRVSFFTLFVLAAVAACNPSLAPIGTVAYLGLAVALGVGNGAVFAIVGHRCDAKLIGTVTGIIGAAGGIGGYFPPLLMGVTFQLFHSYTIALLLLSVVCLAVCIGCKKLLTTDRIGDSYR